MKQYDAKTFAFWHLLINHLNQVCGLILFQREGNQMKRGAEEQGTGTILIHAGRKFLCFGDSSHPIVLGMVAPNPFLKDSRTANVSTDPMPTVPCALFLNQKTPIR